MRKIEKISRPLSFLAGAYGDIFFVGNTWFGALILCCTFLVPNIGAHGLLAGLCALGILRAVNPTLQDSIFARVAVCNSILLGLYFGSLFKLSPAGLMVLFVATPGILAVTGPVMNVLARRGLPALSLPFSIVGVVTFLWGSSIASLVNYKPYLLQNPFPPAVFFGWEALSALIRTLGSIIFLPG
ncbi:MAG: urea transporter, partial [Elusimicrobiota bacterium]